MGKIANMSTSIRVALITGVFGLIIAVIGGIFLLFQPSPQQTVIVDLPETIPTVTPKPTVVGTPIMGADLAVGGKVGETIVANNVKMAVDKVTAYSQTSEGYPLSNGYVWVVVELRVFNGSNNYITIFDFRLVDDFSNEYVTWGGYGNKLPALPNISIGQSGAGVISFQVPEPALAQKLRLSLKLESGSRSDLSTLLIVFFDDVLHVEKPDN
jgi:hypothetical protein